MSYLISNNVIKLKTHFKAFRDTLRIVAYNPLP
nr:MAG TPA: hypothetical protein [Caudoviricetes sp.]